MYSSGRLSIDYNHNKINEDFDNDAKDRL